MADNEQQTTSAPDRKSPGEVLQETRESLNLTRSDVAAQLNLQLDTIAALEEDNHDKLPVSTYVRGYLRIYARLLKIDGNELVDRYDNTASSPPEILPDVKKHTQASSRDKPVRAVTYLVTFGMALLLLAWLQSEYVITDGPEKTGDGETGDEAWGGDISYPIDVVVHPETPYFDNRTDNSGDYPPLYDDMELDDNVINTMELPNSLAIDENIPQSAATEVGATREAPAGAAGPYPLVMIITEKSWIEVTDAGDNRLYHGLASPGDTIRLEGDAPFSVLLGFAPGVTVRFRGEDFDTDAYSNDGVARFTLGE